MNADLACTANMFSLYKNCMKALYICTFISTVFAAVGYRLYRVFLTCSINLLGFALLLLSRVK